MPERPALLFAVGATLLAIFPLLLALVASPPASAWGYPVEVLSLERPPGPQTPAGPTVQLAVENVGDTPIVSLNATLQMPYHPYPFSFSNVTAATPLDPGQTATTEIDLFSGYIDCGAVYSLEVSGEAASGGHFDFVVTTPYLCPGPDS